MTQLEGRNGSITELTTVTPGSAGAKTCGGVLMLELLCISGTLTEILETTFYVTIRAGTCISRTPTSLDILPERGGIRPWVSAHAHGVNSSSATSTETRNQTCCAMTSTEAGSGLDTLRQAETSNTLHTGTAL